MTQSGVYLDHNASTMLLAEARAAIGVSLDLTGNPSSVHGAGRALKALLEKARDQIVKTTGAERAHVVFTGSATEAITQAIVGGAKTLGFDEVIISAGEHAAVLKAAEMTGLPVTQIGLSTDGVIDVEALAEAVNATGEAGRVALVGVHAVNNETGIVQPVDEIEALVGPTPHFLFVDAVQAFGKLPLNFAARATDMMAISAHKIGGPAGVGALLMKAHCDAARLIPGGGQEQGRRGGTESVALIAGFGAAAEKFSTAYDADAILKLVDELEAGLQQFDIGVEVFGAGAVRIGNVVNFAVPGMKASVAMMGLDLEGVAVSSGSACSSGKVGRSHVLEAMGVAPELGDCALRVSLGWSSTRKDVDAFLTAFEKVLGQHRKGRAA